MRFPARAGLLTVLFGAGPGSAQVAPTRSAEVVAEFGGRANDPAAELSRVGSVLRLEDGRFVVATGRPREVRLYTAAGVRLGALGRSGEGPGEFRDGVTVRPWTGDSILLLSLGTRQWLLYSLDGRFVRQWQATSEDVGQVHGFSLSGGAVVSHRVIGSAGCSLALLRQLVPARGDTLSEAMTDDRGRVWLRPYGTSVWSVHGANGSLIARIGLPGSFRTMQFDGPWLTGVREDADGFEHVVVLRHGLGDVGRVATPECTTAPEGIDLARAAEVKTAIRNAMTAAEAFYADRGRYPSRADEYPDGVKPHGGEFRVMRGDRGSFAISVIDRETGYRCIVTVGAGNDLDGAMLCGR